MRGKRRGETKRRSSLSHFSFLVSLFSHFTKGVIVHYRETIAWQKAVEMVREMYSLVPNLPREETFGIRSQITRAAVSVAANLAEGWARESTKEKSQFLAIAHGSIAEVETLFTICEQVGWFPQAQTLKVRSLLDELSRMMTTMRRNRRG
ncbi:MAG TPA: four helix bundle protein [Candidatus Binataceae bacterium]|jgi:four helix bundle protein|nr:four helix bundle protein [Candidatus Binataceae bacterium]